MQYVISESEYFVGSNPQLRTLNRVGFLAMTNVGSMDNRQYESLYRTRSATE